MRRALTVWIDSMDRTCQPCDKFDYVRQVTGGAWGCAVFSVRLEAVQSGPFQGHLIRCKACLEAERKPIEEEP